MPKTTKPFDWEIYDSEGEFIDVLTMTRSEASEFHKTHPDYKLTELGYTNNEEDEYDKSNYYTHQIKIPKRKRKFK